MSFENSYTYIFNNVCNGDYKSEFKNDYKIKLREKSSPEFETERTSTGSEPRRRNNRVSPSFRRKMSRLNLYHADEPAVSEGPADIIGPRISGPPDDRRRTNFFRFRDLPLKLDRLIMVSHGTELRLWLLLFWVSPPTVEAHSGWFSTSKVSLRKKEIIVLLIEPVQK